MLSLGMFSNTAEQTRLFNYSRGNINFSHNERLCALAAQQKCSLLGRANTLYSVVMARKRHPALNKWQERPCVIHPRLLSVNERRFKKKLSKQIWDKDAKISQYIWCILVCTYAFWTVKCGKQRKEKRQTYIAFDCIRQYLCVLNLSPLA